MIHTNTLEHRCDIMRTTGTRQYPPAMSLRDKHLETGLVNDPRMPPTIYNKTIATCKLTPHG